MLARQFFYVFGSCFSTLAVILASVFYFILYIYIYSFVCQITDRLSPWRLKIRSVTKFAVFCTVILKAVDLFILLCFHLLVLVYGSLYITVYYCCSY